MTRDLLLVTLSLFAWGFGEGAFVFFQTLYMEQLGASPIQIGAVLSAMGLSMAFSQAPAGYLADRFGQRPLMWFSWLMGVLATWLMALANALPAFIAGFLIYGLTASVMAPMNSYITAVRGKWNAERALTVTAGVYNLGMVLSPSLGGLLAARFGLRSVYWFGAVLFVVSTVIVLFIRKPPVEFHTESEKPGWLTHNKSFMVLLGLTLLTMFALYLPQPLTPNFLQNERGLTIQQIGWMGTLASLGMVVLSLTLGHLQGKTGFLVAQPLLALFSIFIWHGRGVAVFGLGYFLSGGYRLARAMVLAEARKLIHARQTGLAYGLLETANAVAIILAPMLAGFLYQNDPRQVYQVALLMIALVLLLNLILLPRLRAPKETAPAPIAPLTETPYAS